MGMVNQRVAKAFEWRHCALDEGKLSDHFRPRAPNFMAEGY